MRTKSRIALSAFAAVFFFCILSETSYAATVFFDNMESGTSGWTGGGFWHRKTDPQNTCVIPDISPRLVSLPDNGCLPHAYSGSSVWWYGEDSTGTYISSDYLDYMQTPKNGGYSSVENAADLETPAFSLAGATTAMLTFKSWWEIESVMAGERDHMYVFLTNDSEQSEESVYYLLGEINPLDDGNGRDYGPYSSGGLGKPGVWVTNQFDLTPYAGSTWAKIAFTFDTGEGYRNGFRGWLIDDVMLTVNSNPAAPVITGVSPSAGIRYTVIQIQGANFVNGANVSIGGQQCDDIAVVSSSLIQASSPYSLSVVGKHDLTVTNPGGEATTMPDAFNYQQSVSIPDVDRITPASGINNQSTAVQISGYNFFTGTTVEIASTPLLNVTVFDSSKITAIVPAGLPEGYQNIAVTDRDNQTGILIGGFLVNSSETACTLAGDNPPCETVSLTEVIALINAWAAGSASLNDAIALINAWAAG